MKKLFAGFLFFAMICTLACGCGKDEDNSASETAALSEEESAVTVSEVSKSTSPDKSSAESEGSVPLMLESSAKEHSTIEFSIGKEKAFSTLDEFINSKQGKDAVDAFLKGLSENDKEGVFSSKVYAEGNDFVLERQFGEDFNLWLKDNTIANLKENVETDSSAYTNVVDLLESCIDQRNIKFLVRYTDPEGNVLYEKKFDNTKPVSQPSQASSGEQNVSAQESSEA